MTDEHNPEAVAELLPCPFCGGAAKMHRQRDSFGTLNLSIANISCDRGCVHQSGYRETNVSIAAWNRRIPALVIATGRDTDAALVALRADAQAAAALVVERAAAHFDTLAATSLKEHGATYNIRSQDHWLAVNSKAEWAAQEVRALAPADGLAAVDALRAERDAAREALMNAGIGLHVAKREAAEAVADRDRLAAANAALEAKLARLVETVERAIKDTMLRLGKHPDIRRIMAPQVMWGAGDSCISAIRAALAEVQADARREGGE